MSLITRQGKGSRLSIQDMDNNLIYLESLAQQGGGTGLGGTNYKFIKGDGTPTENGLALMTAYTEAKSSTPNSNTLSSMNRMIIVVGSGQYLLSSELVLDTEFIDIVSLTGNKDIILVGSNTINITASNIIVRGIECLDKPFKITNDNLNVLIEKCSGSDESFGYNQIVIGEFNNCIGGENSFGMGGTFSGILNNCELIDSSFNDLNNIGGEINYSKDIKGLYLIKYTEQPDTQLGFDDLTLVTKKWVEDNSASTLDEVLNLGNRTGNNDIIIDDGQSINFEKDGFILDQYPYLNGFQASKTLFVDNKYYLFDDNQSIALSYDSDYNLLDTYNLDYAINDVTYNSILNRIYLNWTDIIGDKYYIDCNTNTLINIVPTVSPYDGDANDYVFFDEVTNKLYTLSAINGTIEIYDEDYVYESSISITDITVFSPQGLMVNPLNGNIIISVVDSNDSDNKFIIIDSTSGLENTRIVLPDYPSVLRYNNVDNCYYFVIYGMTEVELWKLEYDSGTDTYSVNYVSGISVNDYHLEIVNGKIYHLEVNKVTVYNDVTNVFETVFEFPDINTYCINIQENQDTELVIFTLDFNTEYYFVELRQTVFNTNYLKPNNLSDNREWLLPDKSGIIALTDDIPEVYRYSNVFFVDEVNGIFNGEMNEPTKPFYNISQAVNEANDIGTWSNTNRALVYVRRGEYIFSNITLRNNVDIYFEPGAVLINSSISVDSPNINSNIYGHLNINNDDNTIPINLGSNSGGCNIYIEFDKIISTRRAVFNESVASNKLTMKGNYIYSEGAGCNCTISLRHFGNNYIDVKTIEGWYAVLDFRNISGENIINCDNINLLPSGTAGNYKQCILCYNAATTPGKITVNSNLNVLPDSNHGSITSAVRFWGGVNYTLELNGNIIANQIPGVVLSNTSGKFIMNGNIQSNRQLISNASDTVMELNNSKMVKNVTGVSDGVIPIVISNTSQLYISNSTIYSEYDGSVITPINSTELYLNNVQCESPTTSAQEFIYANPHTPSVGLINVASSNDIDPTIVPEYLVNYSVVSNIKVPKL